MTDKSKVLYIYVLKNTEIYTSKYRCAIVLVGPITYQTKIICMFNIIVYFFIHHFYFSNAHTNREYTSGNSKPNCNKI